ncbi:MAG: Xaa-Pro peptidase family protein [Candidatus Marinimicrobia bacterium]|nr:Xaa-Pro peptidase family protein [Candidatus Neomarinimicrobiota bacterium]
MQTRINEVRKYIKENQLDGFLVFALSNVRYLSGYTGSNGLCYITKDKQYFFTDFRYKSQSKMQVKDFEIIIAESGGLLTKLKEINLISKGDNIGFEGNNISFDQYKELEKDYTNTKFYSKSMVLENIASVKDEDELNSLRKAAEITDRIFDKIIKEIKIGITEKEIASKISYYSKIMGDNEDSFAPIVASGLNGSKPHHTPSDKKIANNEFITMDFGAVYNGYHGDMTRTIFIGDPDEKQKEIYNIVSKAQMLGIENVKPGISGKELDSLARDYITDKGYGEYFGHGLGHGIGLVVHAEPRVSQKNKNPMQVNNVITIEPGIYIPKWGGIRIEDDVIVTKNGYEVISKSPKELTIL